MYSTLTPVSLRAVESAPFPVPAGHFPAKTGNRGGLTTVSKPRGENIDGSD